MHTAKHSFYVISGLCSSENSSLASLTNDIFANYDPSIIPYCRGKTQVNVTMDLAIRQLIDMVRSNSELGRNGHQF